MRRTKSGAHSCSYEGRQDAVDLHPGRPATSIHITVAGRSLFGGATPAYIFLHKRAGQMLSLVGLSLVWLATRLRRGAPMGTYAAMRQYSDVDIDTLFWGAVILVTLFVSVFSHRKASHGYATTGGRSTTQRPRKDTTRTRRIPGSIRFQARWKVMMVLPSDSRRRLRGPS
jgi:hypothetical protein